MIFDAVTISKYAGVAAALILSGFGAPIPEEIPIVTAGAMVGHDSQLEAVEDLLNGAIGGGPAAYLTPTPDAIVKWWIMLPLCIVSVVMGDSVLYTIGRVWGTRLMRLAWVQRRVLPLEKQQQIETNFHKNGIMILLGARLTPGIRSPVFVMAGVLRMPFRRFLLADALYAIPGVNLLFWLSYWFTDQFVEAIKAVDRHRPMVILAILSAAGGVVIYKFLTSWNLATGSVEDIPAYAKPVGVVTNAIEKTVEMTIEKTIEKTASVIDKVTHPMGHADKSHLSSKPVLVPLADPKPVKPPEN